MTIKTPEQIAAEAMLSVMEYVSLDDASMAAWTGALVAAIEADRAQRSRVLDALHTWAVDVSYSLSTDKSNDWSEELDELASIERFYGLVDEDGERL